MNKILELRGLSRNFDGLQAVSDVDLEVERGTVIGLAGPNGAGKTTLFNMISGFISPSSGEVYFEEYDITGWSVTRRVQAGITRTFQESRVFPGLTVRENVLTGRYPARDRNLFDSLSSDSGGAFKGSGSPLKWILEVTNLGDYGETLACNLSYGYRQRLELAIAIATDPKLLLLDEPFSGTHASDLQELAGLLSTLRDAGLTVILVEHDIASVTNVSDRLVYMESGKVTIPND
ncbi:MAG: ABC transporter ATP-binding protein [Candidatus Bipolaricaulota bacterium]|nr:ABC transporter ATP-binding protein [Candidatus Bipolaricaulota bacterium]